MALFQIVENVDKIIRDEIDNIFELISKEHGMDIAELQRLIVSGSKNCLYKFTRGKNKGEVCGKSALNNNYCKAHQGFIVKLSASMSITSKVSTSENSIVKNTVSQTAKTKEQILEWLNTAVPQEITKLYRHSLGLIHKETEIIFNDKFMAIGKLENDKLVNLESFEIDYCEKMGWKYLT